MAQALTHNRVSIPAFGDLGRLFGLVLFVAAQTYGQGQSHRFEANVLAYEAIDKTNPPPHNAILLVGDSQFYRWKTVHEDLPGYTIINRGIDSFQMSDLLFYADRLVLPYRPRMIVMHVGGNDTHSGRNADQILKDFQSFVAKVREKMPEVTIAFTSMTPGPGRWSEAPQRKEANQVIKEYVATQPGLLFIDLWDAMLKSDGQPRQDLWVADGVHPNHNGYLLRVKIMRPILGPPDQKNN
jgi:lysophospholipase L1-like esterase